MNPEEYRKKIESDILLIIEEKLLKGEIDESRVKSIARMVLQKLHPPLTLDQIYKIVPTLDDEFAELAKAVLPVMQDHEKSIRDVVLHETEKLMKSGKFDEASSYIKNEMNK